MGRDGRRLVGDDGSVFAEFTLVLPFLAFVVLGIFEFGTAFRNTGILANALRSTVRVQAQIGTTSGADLEALKAFRASIAETTNLDVTKVIIYNATATATTSSAGASGTPSVACRTALSRATAPDGCNVYFEVDLESGLVASNFGGSVSGTADCTGKFDVKFCPMASGATGRTNSLAAGGAGVGGGPTLVGIWAEASYTSMTKLLPATVVVRDFTTSRLEPA